MNVKMFEVRDKGTFIPVICIELETEKSVERWLLDRLGFADDTRYIQLIWISKEQTQYDPLKWNDRTMLTAHRFIQELWDELDTGDLIDVELILREKDTKKISERFEE